MSLLVQRSLSSKKPEQNATTPVNLHRPLYIEKVDRKDYELIAHIAKDWASIAQKKMSITDNTEERWAWEELISCRVIADSIADTVEDDSPDCEQMYVCKEIVSEKIYGIAVGFQNNEMIHGSFLVTHPHNIRCKANRSESLRVKGVGTAFIKFVEEECKKQSKTLYFVPQTSAEPFYQKFGYIEGKNSKSTPASKL
ncbi:MAG TPA: GNAT family N-acetyltransferase [Chlamydiales bacterium]|jgi:hypothetical protein|nr:GNAT family N-acetyltransferase [Chlamydiales bacterium]